MANQSEERKTFGYFLIMVLIVFAVILYILPIYWIVVTSLKSPGDINTIVPKFFFNISLENYRKLLPEENVSSVTYLFIAQTLGGLLLFALFSLVKPIMSRAALVRNIGLICNIIFVLTCIYSFFSTQPLQSRSQVDVRFHFFTLIVCNIAAYLFFVPWRKGISSVSNNSDGDLPVNPKERFAFVIPVILATIGVCIALANGGSKYFYQLLNSIIIGVGSTVLAVGLGTLSAYAFSRFKIAGKDDLLFFILSTRMLPPVVVVIPIFLMYNALGLRDTHFGMILLYTTFNVSFAVWLMKGFIDEIPREYEDAALVDGYTRFQTFLKVVLPQSVTGIAATAVFCLITAWNEFAFALVLTETGGRAVTAPPSITSATGSAGIDWGKIAASTFVFLLPVAIFTFLMRSHLLRGVTFGAVKK
jgi:ABC-type glycerol-3-phosphate transport system permease component